MGTYFQSPYKNIYISGFLVFIITSVFSTGFYHPDEHFQILEFCSYKLGMSPASDLPWEFNERIRPTLQPVICYTIIRGLNFINIHNPFTYTLVLRIISALLSWLVISKACQIFIKDFSSEKGKKIFLFLSFFLWFVPFFSVRFSSENYSAITFLGAVILIFQSGKSQIINKVLRVAAIGLLLGFSFCFRFQVGFAIIGLAL